MNGGGTALLILRLCGYGEGEKSGLSKIVIALLSVMIFLVLLFALILDILSSPFSLGEELDEFQNKYSALVAAETLTLCEPLTDAEIKALIEQADTDNPERLEILQVALSLVGKVPYFWGGKPTQAGWNEDWLKLRQVTAEGSETTDSLRAYGLDCSGLVDWVWWTAGLERFGSGTTVQFWASEEIAEADLLPGDLVFQYEPNPDTNHVGIYCGTNAAGEKLYIHCSAAAGGVTINSYDGFRIFRRPPITSKEETISDTGILSLDTGA